MTTSLPISVVMPVYNASKHLKEAIDSVLGQAYSDFEFIIVNDGSTDNSESIISAYSDKRIKYIKQDNAGVGGALKTGCNLATGKYIARMDADDVCLPERFQHQKAFLDKNPTFVLVGSAVINITESGEYLNRSFPYTSNSLLHELVKDYSPICHPSVMMQRSAYLESGGYEEFEPLEDILLWFNLSKIGKLENLTSPLLKYRIVESSVSRSITKKQSEALREYLFSLMEEKSLINEKSIKFKKLYDKIKNDIKNNNNDEVTRSETRELLFSLETRTYGFLRKMGLSEEILENCICEFKKLFRVVKFKLT